MGDNIFKDGVQIDYEETVGALDADAFTAVVEARRSVRVYTDEPVPEAVMNRCIDEALLSPNSSNLQPWGFYWVRSAEKRAALVEACFGQPAAATAQELVVVVGRTGTWRQSCKEMVQTLKAADAPPAAISYYEKLAPMVYNQGPLGILGLGKWLMFSMAGLFRPVPREPSSAAGMRTWASKTGALACQTFMLSVRANGFDTCPMEGLDSRRVRKILGLPRDAVVVMAISVGKRAEGGVYGPRLRFPRDRFVFEV